MNLTHQWIFYGGLSFLIPFFFGIIPLWERWRHHHLHHFVSFSAGVLIATAFLHILPDAIGQASPKKIGVCVLASFLTLFILEKFVMLHACEETHCDYHTVGMAAFLGMSLHTFFDGIALGASLLVPKLAPIVFFAIIIHKIPESFSLASILRKTPWSLRKIFVFIFAFSLIVPIGAATSLKIFDFVGQGFVGIALSLSLGTFIYISTSDFLPEVHRAHSSRMKNLLSFLSGVVVVAVFEFTSGLHSLH